MSPHYGQEPGARSQAPRAKQHLPSTTYLYANCQHPIGPRCPQNSTALGLLKAVIPSTQHVSMATAPWAKHHPSSAQLARSVQGAVAAATTVA